MVIELEIPSNVCPECQGLVISNNQRGEVVCEQCGLVVNERSVDMSHSGIRAYNQHEKERKEQMGSPMSVLMPNISLSTIIEKHKIKNPDLKRAVKWNSQLTWQNRNLLLAITELKRLGTNLNFSPRTKKAAVLLYKEIVKKNILRGRSIHGMIAACAYYICREEKVPITLQEILHETSVNGRSVKRCYKILMQELHLKSPPIDVISLIPRYCTELGLNFQIEYGSIKLLDTFLGKMSICGKDPKGYVAGSIYLVAKFKDLNLTQKQVSSVVGVTEVTLRSRYKELLNHLKLNVN